MSYGLAIIYGVMRVINLSHAGFLMLGAFMTLVYFQRWHLDPVLAGFVNLPVFFVAGVLVYRVLVRRVTTSLPIASLLLPLGPWLLSQNLAVAGWGGGDPPMPSPSSLN